MRLVLSGVNLFAWILVFQFYFARTGNVSQAFLNTIFLYAFMQVVILLVTPYSAMHLRNGLKGPMTLGILAAAVAYLALALSFSGTLGAYVAIGIFAFTFFRGLYRAMYWVPYQVDLPHTAPSNPRTRITQEIVVALMPTLCGLILTAGLTGFYIILSAAIAVLLVSLVVLHQTPDVAEGYSWGYFGSFKKLFSRRHNQMVSIALLDGIGGAALLLFWPIAVFLLVGWSYPVLGITMSFTYLIVFFSRSYVRAFFRRLKLEESALLHAALSASSWILRLVVSTPLGIVLVDSYFYTGTQVRGTGIDMSTFEQSADHGSYIDELTTLKEMSLAFGKICMCLLGALFVATVSVPLMFIIVFMIAAIASGASVFLTRRSNRI